MGALTLFTDIGRTCETKSASSVKPLNERNLASGEGALAARVLPIGVTD